MAFITKSDAFIYNAAIATGIISSKIASISLKIDLEKSVSSKHRLLYKACVSFYITEKAGGTSVGAGVGGASVGRGTGVLCSSKALL